MKSFNQDGWSLGWDMKPRFLNVSVPLIQNNCIAYFSITVKHCTYPGSTHFPELLAIQTKSFHAISQSLNLGSRVVLWNVWHPLPNTCLFTVYHFILFQIKQASLLWQLFCFDSLHMWLSCIVCLYILRSFPLLSYKINDLEKEQINKNAYEFYGYS